jgi:hypothetical protein
MRPVVLLLLPDLLGEIAVHVLHEARELQGVVYPQQGMKMIREADQTAAGHSIEPLGSAHDAEDDLVQSRARPQEQSGLERPDCHLHQSAPFGHEAHTTWHLKGIETGNAPEMSFLRMLKDSEAPPEENET